MFKLIVSCRHHWAATRGVDEDEMLQSLPADLRRGIKFHMCMNLICNVRFRPFPLLASCVPLDSECRKAEIPSRGISALMCMAA